MFTEGTGSCSEALGDIHGPSSEGPLQHCVLNYTHPFNIKKREEIMQFLPLILVGLQALDLQIVLVDPVKTEIALMTFFKLSEQWQLEKQ